MGCLVLVLMVLLGWWFFDFLVVVLIELCCDLLWLCENVGESV